jgi:hypothetical protein
MRMLVDNDTCHGTGRPLHHCQQEMDSSYSDFLETRLPLFYELTDLLEVDNWLRTT